MISCKSAVSGLCLIGLASAASAEPGALFAGRSGDPSSLSDVSVELGYVTDDGGNIIGARLNYRLDERTMLYGDFGMVEFEDEDSLDALDGFNINVEGVSTAEADGNGFGAGVFYHLPDFSESADVSLQASYHTSDLDGSGRFAVDDGDGGLVLLELDSVESTVLYGGLLASLPEPVAENGLIAYGTLGYAQVDVEVSLGGGQSADDDISGLAFGLGFLLPVGPGHLYGGYESFDGEGSLGGGFRYDLR